MEYSPKLRRQRSCSYFLLGVGSWCNSSRRSYVAAGFSRRYSDDDKEYYSSCSQTTRWRELWRRIVREKRRIFLSSSSGPMQHVRPNYDPYTYAQNFDDGSAWVEPENLSRSFSARFAAPSSRMLQRVA